MLKNCLQCLTNCWSAKNKHSSSSRVEIGKNYEVLSTEGDSKNSTSIVCETHGLLDISTEMNSVNPLYNSISTPRYGEGHEEAPVVSLSGLKKIVEIEDAEASDRVDNVSCSTTAAYSEIEGLLEEDPPKSSSFDVEDEESLKLKGLVELSITAILALKEENLSNYDKLCEGIEENEKFLLLWKPQAHKDCKFPAIRCHFEVPCSPEEFIQFISKPDEAFNLFENIDKLTLFRSVGQDYSLYYALYKKMMIYNPRDFVYVRHSRCLDERKGTWIDVIKTIEDEEFPEQKNFVRGNFILQAHLVEAVEGAPKKSRILLYSEVDFKLSLSYMIMKPFLIKEFKTFIKKYISRIKILYS